MSWQVVPLGTLCDVYDGPHGTPAKTEAGPWYLSISSLRGGRLQLSESAHLTWEDFPRWTKRVRPLPGDTLFSYETRLGESAYWELEVPAALGRRMGLLRPKPGVDPRFLSLAYQSPQFQGEITRRAVQGATVDRIPIGEMADWPIAVPPLDEQRRIAEVLGSLDDLIDTNEQLQSDLDELARATFLRTWDGESWTTVAELGEVIMGQSPPGDTYSDTPVGVPFHQGVRDFGARFPTSRIYCSAPTRIAEAGDILIAVRAPVGEMNVAPERLAIGRGLAALRATRPSIALQAIRAFESTWSAHQGTGTVFSSINGKDLRAAKVPLVDDETVEATLSELDHAYVELDREGSELRRTRDELLPLLMSGAVRVPSEGVAA